MNITRMLDELVKYTDTGQYCGYAIEDVVLGVEGVRVCGCSQGDFMLLVHHIIGETYVTSLYETEEGRPISCQVQWYYSDTDIVGGIMQYEGMIA